VEDFGRGRYGYGRRCKEKRIQLRKILGRRGRLRHTYIARKKERKENQDANGFWYFGRKGRRAEGCARRRFLLHGGVGLRPAWARIWEGEGRIFEEERWPRRGAWRLGEKPDFARGRGVTLGTGGGVFEARCDFGGKGSGSITAVDFLPPAWEKIGSRGVLLPATKSFTTYDGSVIFFFSTGPRGKFG